MERDTLLLKQQASFKIILIYLIIPILLIIGIGILAIVQLNQISATVNNLTNNLEKERALSKDIISQILLTRFYANQYARSQSQNDLDNFNTEFSTLEGLLVLANSQITDFERVEMLYQINLVVQKYGETFDEITVLVKRQQRIYTEVVDIKAHILDSELTALRLNTIFANDPAVFLAFGNAQNAFQLMRLNTAKYLEAGDERYAVLFELNYRETQTALSNLEELLQDPLQQKNAIDAMDAAEAYYQGFQTIRSDYDQLKTLLNTMLDVLEPKISNVSSDIATNVEREFKVQNDHSQALINQTRLVLFFTTTLAIVASLGFGIVSSQYIRERLQSEEELKRYRDHLEHLVEERTVELTKTNSQLRQEIDERLQTELALEQAKQNAEEANRAKSIFLANMSHELRTPLNGILGYAQILKRTPGLSEQQTEGLNIIEQSGNHLLTLIVDILDISKIEAGKMELYPTEINFPHFLESITSIIHLQAQQKDIHFVYKADNTLPKGIKTDEKRLREILLNLLGNAVKFTDKGEVSLTVYPLNEIQTHSNGKTHTLRFEIEDTGSGIDPWQADKIFKPFEQGGNTQQRKEGTGLGLVISQQLVKLLGGKLQMKSPASGWSGLTPPESLERGPGTIFWFELAVPVIENEVKTTLLKSRQIIGIDGKRPKALVVDDNPTSRRVLTNLLAPVGFEIIEATNGREGFIIALAFHPDVTITDLRMPEMDGFELIHQIRQSTLLKNMVIITTSANAYKEDRQQSLSAGSNSFIPKPVKADHLFEALHQHLNLTWIYEECEFTETPEDQISTLPGIMIPPPQDDLLLLVDLTKMGDIEAIQDQAERLIQTDEQYQPFGNELHQLAKRFQLNKLQHWLESYL